MGSTKVTIKSSEETQHDASAVAISANCSITGSHDQQMEVIFFKSRDPGCV